MFGKLKIYKIDSEGIDADTNRYQSLNTSPLADHRIYFWREYPVGSDIFSLIRCGLPTLESISVLLKYTGSSIANKYLCNIQRFLSKSLGSVI